MHFAKLFSYTIGQLVVMWHDATEPDSETQPYVLTTLIRGEEVTFTMEHLYSSQPMRNADFEAFEEPKAAELLATQQKFLASMGDALMQMDFAKLFDFGPADGLPEGQLLVLVQDSDARADADAPYQLVLTTMSAYGRLMTQVYSYAEETVRDAEFTDLVTLAAKGHYRHMQAELTQVTA